MTWRTGRRSEAVIAERGPTTDPGPLIHALSVEIRVHLCFACCRRRHTPVQLGPVTAKSSLLARITIPQPSIGADANRHRHGLPGHGCRAAFAQGPPVYPNARPWTTDSQTIRTCRVICSLRSHSERSLDIIPGGQHLFGISLETRWGTMIGRIHSRSPSGSITILICST